jgi:hypothetical protein
MTTNRRRVLSIGGPAVAGVILFALTVIVPAFGALQVPQDRYITQPMEWIPITYEYETRIDGHLVFAYTVSRSSDGSTRQERRDGLDIQILNRTLRRFFWMHRDAWTDHPMRPQPNGDRPFLRLTRNRVTHMSSEDPRVQAVKGVVDLSPTFYELRTSADQSTIFCPELNMLEVWFRMQRSDGVVERQVTSVALGEPQVDFRPPPSASITVSTEPAGPGRVLKLPSGREYPVGAR